MRFLWSLIKLGVLLALLGVFMRSFGAKWLMSVYLQGQLGARVEIEDAKIDFVNAQLKFTNLAIRNPLVFPEGTLMIIPKLYLHLKPASLLRGRVELETLEMNVSEIRVLQTPDHGMNLRGVKLLRAELPQESGAEAAEKKSQLWDLQVNRFVLSIGRVTYTDLRGENPLQKSREQVLSHAVFENISRMRGLWGVLVFQTLNPLGLGDA